MAEVHGSPSTELVTLALGGWTADAAKPHADHVAEAIERVQGMMRPLSEVEPKPGEGMRRLDATLRTIGAKIAPTIGDEQAKAWRTAMILALSDLPPRVSIASAKDVLHRPMRYLNEVEGEIRERAEHHAARLRVALNHLRNFQREVAVTKLPPPPGYEGGQTPPLDREEMRRTAQSEQGRAILRVGLANGHIAQEDFDYAMKQEIGS